MFEHHNLNSSRAQEIAPSAEIKLQEIQASLKKHPHYKIIKQQVQKSKASIHTFSPGKRKVTIKMLLKLTKWMAQVSKETFQFSTQTLQLSTKILFSYLQIEDQPSAQLQLIGCVCLHLASKLTEIKIYAIQNYEALSKNIFTKSDFEDKERYIFQQLGGSIGFLTMNKIINFFRISLDLSQNEVENLRNLSQSCITDDLCWNYDDYSIILYSIALEKTNKQPPTKMLILQALALKYSRSE